MRCHCLILGGGIIGSAVAYEMSRRGISDIHVVDADLEGELSSTERNAGGVRHLWQHRVNVELARHSIAFFEKIRNEIGFQQTGYLWLQPKNDNASKELLKTIKDFGTQYEEWDTTQIQKKYPFIDRTDNLAFGLFGSKDGLINSNVLKTYFRDQAKSKGTKFHDHYWVRDVQQKNSQASVKLERLPSQEAAQDLLKSPEEKAKAQLETWEAEVVILCMGAWVQQLPQFADLRNVFRPIRRQIAFFKTDDFDMSPYGMVVDTSRVYFHPEGGSILAGFVVNEEKPGYNFDYDPSFFESHIWPALYERSSKFERLKHISGWGGLYNYTPDKTGILGQIPGCPSLFEAHSFTGRGVMQSYGAAIAISELILDKKFLTFDASALSRERLKNKSRWIQEGLHI